MQYSKNFKYPNVKTIAYVSSKKNYLQFNSIANKLLYAILNVMCLFILYSKEPSTLKKKKSHRHSHTTAKNDHEYTYHILI